MSDETFRARFRITETGLEHYKVKHTSNVVHVETMQVIAIESRVGEGTHADPVRIITEYYSMDGALLARIDNYATADGEAQ